MKNGQRYAQFHIQRQGELQYAIVAQETTTTGRRDNPNAIIADRYEIPLHRTPPHDLASLMQLHNHPIHCTQTYALTGVQLRNGVFYYVTLRCRDQVSL